jgi:hypothetical protein
MYVLHGVLCTVVLSWYVLVCVMHCYDDTGCTGIWYTTVMVKIVLVCGVLPAIMAWDVLVRCVLL